MIDMGVMWEESETLSKEISYRNSLSDKVRDELTEVIFDLKVDAFKNRKRIPESGSLSEDSNPTEVGSIPTKDTNGMDEREYSLFLELSKKIRSWEEKTKYRDVTSYHLEVDKVTGEYSIWERYYAPGPDKPDWTRMEGGIPNIVGRALIEAKVIDLE